MIDYEAISSDTGANTAGYLGAAIDLIDYELGEGTAVKNPALIGAVIQTMAADYQARIIGSGLEDIARAIAGREVEFSDDE